MDEPIRALHALAPREPLGWRARALRLGRRVIPQDVALVHGFYGAGNVGDEAILGATLDLLRTEGLPASVVAVDEEAVYAGWGVPSVDIGANILSKARALARARVYLLGGGGLLKDYGVGAQNVRRWLEWLRLAQRVGVPTMLWSVGVENLEHPESRALVREHLREVDVVTVRDAASAERLRAVGVEGAIHVTADPVPAFVRPYRRVGPGPGSGDRPVVGVSLRHWYARRFETVDAATFERFLDETARALDRLAATHGARFVLVPMRTVPHDDDRVVLGKLAARMRTSSVDVVREPLRLQGFVRRIAGMDLMVGMRLHASVISSTLGVPTVAVAYMPKVADYMAEIGQSDHVAAIPDIDAGWMISEAEAALAHAVDRRRVLTTATDRLVERFHENGRLLRDLLPGRR